MRLHFPKINIRQTYRQHISPVFKHPIALLASLWLISDLLITLTINIHTTIQQHQVLDIAFSGLQILTNLSMTVFILNGIWILWQIQRHTDQNQIWQITLTRLFGMACMLAFSLPAWAHSIALLRYVWQYQTFSTQLHPHLLTVCAQLYFSIWALRLIIQRLRVLPYRKMASFFRLSRTKNHAIPTPNPAPKPSKTKPPKLPPETKRADK